MSCGVGDSTQMYIIIKFFSISELFSTHGMFLLNSISCCVKLASPKTRCYIIESFSLVMEEIFYSSGWPVNLHMALVIHQCLDYDMVEF